MSLAQQQQALLEALWQARPDDAAARVRGALRCADEALLVRGLRAYRTNGRELALRALAAAYPVVAQLLGDENFAPLAGLHWLQHPPARGDVAQWGGALAQHMAALPDLVDEQPYLPDVAKVEWALHCAATAADAALDAASFALLAAADPNRITLRLAPGTRCISSDWPVASIVLAQLHGSEPPGPGAECALVWRRGLKPELRAARPGEAQLIAALQDRVSLADSLQAAPQIDFNPWLAPAVQSGLVLGAEPL